MLRKAEAGYWKGKVENVRNSSEFWKVIKEMQGKTKKSHIGPILNDNHELVTSEKEKAECFNDYFSTIGEKLNTDLGPPQNFDPLQHVYRVTPIMQDIKIDENRVSEALNKHVKEGKSCGADMVKSRDLKLVGNFATKGLSIVFNHCVRKCSFPSQWKVSRLKALFKSGAKMERENFRPISLLSIPSKVFEGILCKDIDNHVISQGISSRHQWAFKPGRSTELLMLFLTERWKQEIENGKVVGVLFLDFRKAFDSINHNTLLMKIQAAGISGNSYYTMENYLTNRRQFVEIDSSCSQEKPVSYGVPQGSLLGPRLFSMHVNDLPDCTSRATVHMFADDTESFCIGDTVDEVIEDLQVTVNEMGQWSQDNGLFIHPKKSEIVLLTKNKFIGPLKQVKLGDNDIKFVEKSKCLGMMIDSQLSWKLQIEKVKTDMSCKIKKLKLMRYLPKEVLSSVYFKAILPAVIYGISVWGSNSSSKMNELESCHIRAARIINKVPKSVNNADVLTTVKWKDLSYMYKRRLACLSHQVYNNNIIEEIQSLFKKKDYTRDMRDCIQFMLPRPRLNIGRSSFKYRAALVWNNLPVDLKKVTSYDSFKKRLSKNSKILETISFNNFSFKQRDNHFNYF